MEAETHTEENRTIIQLTPSFWSLVLTIAAALVTITATIVTRPDEHRVQQMIDTSIRELRADIRHVNEKVEYTRQGIDKIDGKLDELNSHYDRRER